MFKHIFKLSVQNEKNCLQIRYRLSSIVFITAKIGALLSSNDDDNKKDDYDKVFSNKSVTTSENKNAKIYVLNVSKMSWRDTPSPSALNSIMILNSGGI